jgi:hypothetical protein
MGRAAEPLRRNNNFKMNPKKEDTVKFLSVILIIVSLAMAGGVAEGTAHYNDALLCYRNISLVGYPDVTVAIGRLDGGASGTMDYAFMYGVDAYGQSSRVIAVLVAVAIVSENTTWSSGYCHVMFDDCIMSFSTADCRWLNDNFQDTWSDATFQNWLNSHGVVTPLD